MLSSAVSQILKMLCSSSEAEFENALQLIICICNEVSKTTPHSSSLKMSGCISEVGGVIPKHEVPPTGNVN